MAIIKCKMCGGDLTLMEGQSVAECEYCGSRQTVPAADNEKKLSLFARANRLRASCDFDKAAGIYETIVSDFPEEAEAYWGLVLCKFGIEYVDDPATGKKIPTCHRSSYDSVMDDGNFEQAMENADVLAQKVYREEAKQFERIRKGILEVSSSEKPYDIFICYKETDPSGDRTLDSVLAQDLYSALTDKGYRVFFSRITLQGKLGEAYEPYIFAALNSAKVMLAVGTCYEYYNAVWVKNEWSRYLKICEKDKSKHLIPCYKDLDPEDMPREFNHLQGADLGKMGAIQDILFNMEKYIPLQKNTTVIQERIVVGGTGDNKIASLLDRGNMALEDGDWAKADSFFEDVLNNDSKNAQAYLGKTLAQEKCRTMDAFARKRKEASLSVRGKKLCLEPDNARVDELVSRFSLPGYVDEQEIRKLFEFDLSYHSDAAERRQQYQNEQAYWANHKQLSRAEQFAAGPMAENLRREKESLLAEFNERVKQAEAAEEEAKKAVQLRYEAHLQQAEAQAEAKHRDGLQCREIRYQNLLETAKSSSNVAKLKETAAQFDLLGDYQDSRNLAEHCRNRAAEEQKLLDDAAEAKRLAEAKAAAAQKKKKKTIALILSMLAVLAIAAAVLVVTVVIPSQNYAAAEELLAAGNRGEAAMAFGKLGNFRDARERSSALWGEIAERKVFASGSACVAVTADGKVLTTDSYGLEEFAVASWQDIIAIDKGHNVTVGLKSDGTVLVAGDEFRIKEELAEWKDIAAISADMDTIVGLKYDGTVVVKSTAWQLSQETSTWEHIVSIDVCRDFAGHDYIVGVRSDGTAVSVSTGECETCRMPDWSDLAAVSLSGDHMVGLKRDGTVVATGDNSFGVCDVSGWTDVVAVECRTGVTLGLREDGTVVAAGNNNNGQCDVSGWTDIVAVYTTVGRAVGLKSDGHLIFTGESGHAMESWNVKAPELSPEKQELFTAAREKKEAELAEAYAAAERLLETGDRTAAAMAFGALDGYRDAISRSMELWNGIAQRETISAGRYLTLAVRQDGTVAAARDKYDTPAIAEWENIVAVSAGYSNGVGLRADGTVVSYGGISGESEVSGWKNIVAVFADSGVTAGLRADGTVVVADEYADNEGYDVSDWSDIVALSGADSALIGLKADGTVVVAAPVGYASAGEAIQAVAGWEDIIAIAGGAYHVIGLKADGTVVAAGWNSDGQGEVSDWTDIIAISAGNYHTVGLKADGTVLAIGETRSNQCDVNGWQNVAAIAAGGYHTVVMYSDGTAAAVGGKGDEESGRCNVGGWTNLKLPDSFERQTISGLA